MKRMNWILALLLALCLLAGCAAPNEEPPAETEGPAEAPTEAPTTDPGETVFRFTRDNLPRLDGSTSMVPLAEAVCCVLLGETREAVADLVQFNRTTQSFRNLMNGRCDLLLAGEPNAAVFTEMEEAGFDYEIEEIGKDGLVFLVNENNPVNSLTTEQIRRIYTGEITNWKEVGGDDVEIVAFQRNEGAGSQALMRKLVMQGEEFVEAPAEYVAGGMGDLMECVKSYDNSANAIGYSVYYYAHDMEMAQGLKLIAVDGVEPTHESIRNGSYPHRNAYYCVIPAAAAEDSPIRILFNWLMSDEGQALISREGYVSARDIEAG